MSLSQWNFDLPKCSSPLYWHNLQCWFPFSEDYWPLPLLLLGCRTNVPEERTSLAACIFYVKIILDKKNGPIFRLLAYAPDYRHLLSLHGYISIIIKDGLCWSLYLIFILKILTINAHVIVGCVAHQQRDSSHETATWNMEFGLRFFFLNKNGVLWDVMPCGSCKNRRFGGT
jgi:hypothetical protein